MNHREEIKVPLPLKKLNKSQLFSQKRKEIKPIQVSSTYVGRFEFWSSYLIFCNESDKPIKHHFNYGVSPMKKNCGEIGQLAKVDDHNV